MDLCCAHYRLDGEGRQVCTRCSLTPGEHRIGDLDRKLGFPRRRRVDGVNTVELDDLGLSIHRRKLGEP